MKDIDQSLKGSVFQTQRWSLHDGEGIRTTIFLGGCSLRCSWCHNPESWNENPIHRVTVKEVMDLIERDAIFYRTSGGGITFSGGEPTRQGEFLKTLVKNAMFLGIDTAIETSGYFNWEEQKETFEMLDSVFVDIKHMDPAVHRKFTGVDNSLILENIMKISDLGKGPIIRIPLISGINDDGDNIEKTGEFILNHLSIEGVEILPYHNLGEYKYRDLGIEIKHQFFTPTSEKIQEVKEILKKLGVNLVY